MSRFFARPAGRNASKLNAKWSAKAPPAFIGLFTIARNFSTRFPKPGTELINLVCSMRTTEFIEEGLYHVFNRGVDKRQIFMSTADYRRFYENLCLFNDANHCREDGKEIRRWARLARIDQTEMKRDPLVKIHAFCLMPNHFHLLLEQIKNGGVQTFMQRIGIGYANYFNIRHERTGTLFESRFKSVEVKRDAQWEHLPRYIHLNALDLTNLDWRDGKIAKWSEATEALDQFRWSSHHVYLGRGQSLPVVDETAVTNLFCDQNDYLKFLKEWSGRHTLPDSIDPILELT